jgi:PPOX class probable F420-dependent enzyme
MTATATILPASHVDLLDRPLPAALTTEMPDGRLQSTVVWCERDEGQVLVYTMREFQKARNLRVRPRATVLVVEPGDATRWVEVRARVVRDNRDPLAHLNALARRYTGSAPYFGRVVPVDLAEVEHRSCTGSSQPRCAPGRCIPTVVDPSASRCSGHRDRPGVATASRPSRRRTATCWTGHSRWR